MAKNKIKQNGVVYTPEYIVENILDRAGYQDENILEKHVMDNSCGDGAFLSAIVKRYINQYLEKNDDLFRRECLKTDLETYIHGIEIDSGEVEKCINNLNNLAAFYGIKDVNWDIIVGDSLKITKFNGKMDYVLGNPPYVRVHNLKNNFNHVKQQKFTQSGMTDLFIVFYEIGLNMLNESGVLGYITPSSIFKSVAGLEFRKFVINHKLLTKIVDFKHFQPFQKITTYTTIVILDKKNKQDIVEYEAFNSHSKKINFIDDLRYNDFFICQNFYFGYKKDLIEFNNIIQTDITSKLIEIKNGFATLADKVFVSNEFNFKSEYIYNVYKASTGKWKQVIFPYNEDGKLVDFDNFEEELKDYLKENKIKLAERSLSKNSKWYSFGRTQGINDFWKEKISINTLLRNPKDLKVKFLKPGEGIYSGLYIIGNVCLEDIYDVLQEEKFINYIKILGKYKSGGYYTYSSSDLKKYLIYNLYKGDETNEQ